MKKRTVVLQIGEMAVTNKPNDLLQTFGLGSCVAVVLYHQQSQTLAMVHIALPFAQSSLQRPSRGAGYFADNAIPEMVSRLCKKARLNDPSSISAKLIGGTKMMENSHLLDIGNRNLIICREILDKFNIKIVKEHTGGKGISRSVSASVDSDQVLVRINSFRTQSKIIIL